MVQASCGSWSHTLRATTGSRRSGRGSTMTASPATAAYAGAGGMGGGGLSRHEPLHLSRSTGHRSWAMLRQARLLKSSAMKGQAPAWPVPPGALRARHGGLALLHGTVVGATTAHARARRAGLRCSQEIERSAHLPENRSATAPDRPMTPIKRTRHSAPGATQRPAEAPSASPMTASRSAVEWSTM